MAESPDYTFYSGTYGGGLSSADFAKQLPSATAYVARLTYPARLRNGEPTGDNLTQYKRACCAVVDVQAEQGGAGYDSLTVGSFHVQGPEKTYEGELLDAASAELATTCPSLLYQGIA